MATVMGMFPGWSCQVSELQLHSGDIFLLYTDGLTEAASPDGDEFGEERLRETLLQYRALAAAPLLQVLIESVHGLVRANRVTTGLRWWLRSASAAASCKHMGHEERAP
jgi:serine phosphatase RsbU (regulator of sigma subunit)